MKQLHLLKPESKSYGGTLRNKRSGRGARPISTRESMHLVLRSSLAQGDWSFRRKSNAQKISAILNKFSKKYRVRLLSVANVGNHLHLHLQLTRRNSYKPFIRAITAAISMAITGVNRWSKNRSKIRFWDYRPFTRVVRGFRSALALNDYVALNRLEGVGNTRVAARFILASRRLVGSG